MVGVIEHLDATPARLDIRAWQGDNFVLSAQMISVASDGTETPIDISMSGDARMLVKRHPHYAVEAKLGFVADDPANGVFHMSLTDASMGKLEGSYVYDLKLDGKTLLWGSFYVYSAVSEAIA